MKHIAFLYILTLLFVGCDTRDLTGTTSETRPTPVIIRSGTYDVLYEVSGTYGEGTCMITYTDKNGERVDDQPFELPWRHSIRVKVSQSTGIFRAEVSATCADPSKLGKSTAVLTVNEEQKDRASAVGFGATAKANYNVGTP